MRAKGLWRFAPRFQMKTEPKRAWRCAPELMPPELQAKMVAAFERARAERLATQIPDGGAHSGSDPWIRANTAAFLVLERERRTSRLAFPAATGAPGIATATWSWSPSCFAWSTSTLRVGRGGRARLPRRQRAPRRRRHARGLGSALGLWADGRDRHGVRLLPGSARPTRQAAADPEPRQRRGGGGGSRAAILSSVRGGHG